MITFSDLIDYIDDCFTDMFSSCMHTDCYKCKYNKSSNSIYCFMDSYIISLYYLQKGEYYG